MNELPFDQEFVHPYAEDVCRVILDSPEIDQIVVEQNWLANDDMHKLVDKYCFGEEAQRYLLQLMNR